MQGLPIFKPTYGTLAAINLDKGEITWRVPHGDTPDRVRNHPALKGLNIPKTGQLGTSGVGLMVTKTLVVMERSLGVARRKPTQVKRTGKAAGDSSIRQSRDRPPTADLGVPRFAVFLTNEGLG